MMMGFSTLLLWTTLYTQVISTNLNDLELSIVNPTIPFNPSATSFKLSIVLTTPLDSRMTMELKHVTQTRKTGGDVKFTSSTLSPNTDAKSPLSLYVIVLEDPSKQLEPGLVKIHVNLSAGDTTIPTVRMLYAKVVVPVAITDITVMGTPFVPASSTSPLVLTSASPIPLTVSCVVSESGPHARLNDKTLVPTQATLMMTPTQEGNNPVAIYLPFKAVSSSQRLALSLDLSTEAARVFAYQSGTYTLTLLIGDVAYSKSDDSTTRVALGTANIQVAAAPGPRHYALYTKPLLHASDTTLVPLPEITHVNRLPDPRPPAMVSLFFTFGVVLIFGLFLVTVRSQVATDKTSRRQRGGWKNLWIGLFVTSIASILCLFITFWVHLTMVATLQYCLVLSPVVVLTGHYALVTESSSAISSEKDGHKAKRQ